MSEPGSSQFEVLTQRLAESRAQCARLAAENAELLERLSELSGPRPGAAMANGVGPGGTMTRRGVLGKALGAAALTVAGTAALVERAALPAAASDGDNLVAGSANKAEEATSVVYDGTAGFGGVVLLGNDSSYNGTSAGFPAALGGWAGAGATAGKGGVANGVYGFTDNGDGNGVVGVNSGLVAGSGAGVLGTASGAKNVAVQGHNSKGTAVSGTSDSTDGDATAIIGLISSSSPGGFSAAVRGQNDGTSGLGIGVWGSHAGSGWGMYATSISGIGLNAAGGTGTGVSASGQTAVAANGTTLGISASGPSAVQAAGGTVGVDASGPTAVSAKGGTIGVDASGPTAVSAKGGTIGVDVSGPIGMAVVGTVTGVDASGPTAVAASGSTVGIAASGPTGIAVKGTGSAGVAMVATASGAAPTLHATNSGSGPAIQATTQGSSAPGTAAVVGNSRTATGVLGLSTGSVGVEGRSQTGRGAVFAGASAQVKLMPGSRPTHPSSGETGDLYCDGHGRLWFCKKGGSPATWKQVA